MAWTEEDQIACFGCTHAAHRAGIDGLAAQMFAREGDNANRALGSILSDVQSLIEMGRIERANQLINRVKEAIFQAAPIELWKIDEVRAAYAAANKSANG